jgi:hypothetical protein
MPLRLLIFIAVVWLLFTVFVTVFAASANKNEVRNLPKWLWVLICLAVPIVGGLLYLVLGRPMTTLLSFATFQPNWIPRMKPHRSKNQRSRTRILIPRTSPNIASGS